MYGLIDGNNFYASCEQVFNPKLAGKAVVVLSNNDGCIIARSNEAKKLGIPMGAPAFSYENMKKAGVLLMLSANFALYGDMSKRMMQTIATFAYPMEVYSIDEAFLELPNDRQVGKEIRARVKKWTGITVSIGIASTKTLAKLANKKAKKDPSYEGVYVLENPSEIDALLKKTPVSDLWGIGRGLTERLKSHGIYTAYELMLRDGPFLKKSLGVQVERIALELQGHPCFSLEEEAPMKQSLTCSRSFAEPIIKYDELAEIVATFAARTAEKLREEGCLAQLIGIYLSTSLFQKEIYQNSCVLPLSPTQCTFDLITKAKEGLHLIFREGLAYKKAGVYLTELISADSFTPDLFVSSHNPKLQRLMQTIDTIHERYPEKALYFAAQGIKGYPGHRKHVSPKYTTSWDDLLRVRA